MSQPPGVQARRRRPAGRYPTLVVVTELLRRWDDRDPPPERFTSREEEERVKRARADALLTLDPANPEPCQDCPREATA